MRTIRIVFLIILLAAVIYWLWTGDTQFLPYVMITASASMLLTAFEQLSKSWKSVDGYLALVSFLVFGSYGISLLLSSFPY